MNFTILLLSSLFAAQSAFATYTFTCYSSGRNKDDGYFKTSEQIGLLKINQNSVRLEVADKRTKEVGDVYVFNYGDINGGRGAVAGMRKAELNFQKSKYSGDALAPVYIDEDLRSGGKELSSGKKGGRLVFAGHGFSWDWNLCVSDK